MIRKRILSACEFAMGFSLVAYVVQNTALLLVWMLITAAALLFLSYRAVAYILTTRKAQS